MNGCYEVPLIWCDDSVDLPDNFAAAAWQLEFLEKRLSRDPELAGNYKKTIDIYMEKGYIKRLTKEEPVVPVTRKWYLPHHPVINPKKPGKVRRVCDATAKFQGSSLNSHLLSGPDLLNNLVGIFMQFREEKVALSGDIEAMFNQVAVRKQIKLPFVFYGVNPPNQRSKSISSCGTYLKRNVHQLVPTMPC